MSPEYNKNVGEPEFEGAKDKREPNRRRRLGTIE